MRKTKKKLRIHTRYLKYYPLRIVPGAEDRENELEEGETHGLGMIPKVSMRGTITGFAPEGSKRFINDLAPKASCESCEDEKKSSDLNLAPQVIENEA